MLSLSRTKQPGLNKKRADSGRKGNLAFFSATQENRISEKFRKNSKSAQKSERRTVSGKNAVIESYPIKLTLSSEKDKTSITVKIYFRFLYKHKGSIRSPFGNAKFADTHTSHNNIV